MDERGGHNAEMMMTFSLPNLHYSSALDVNSGAFRLDESSSKKINSKNNDQVRFSTVAETAQTTAARTSNLINRSQSLRNRQLKSAHQGVINQHPHLIQQNPSLFLNPQQVNTARDRQAFQGPVAMLGVRGSTSASSNRPRGAYIGNRGATDTTLSVLLHSRESLNSIENNNGNSNDLNDSTAQIKFNTMRYPDRRALYLLGQSNNETATQRWLSRLIARREQRNSQFLQRLKQKQEQKTNSHSPAGVHPPFNTSSPRNSNTRNSFRNNVGPHRYFQQTATSLTPVNLTTRGGRQSSAGFVTVNHGGTPKSARRPGHLESGELFMSNSTGMLQHMSGIPANQGSSNTRPRTRSNENEITVDLTKENTTNIAYRLLGAYIDANPTPLTKTFMNIGEAPSAFVEEYLQDRCMEKLDYRAICTLWLSKLIYEWEIIED